MNYNPADYFVQLLAVAPHKEMECRSTIKKICDSFAVSTLAEDVSKVASDLGSNESLANRRHTNGNGYRASWLTQFYAVLWRSALSVLKEPMLVKVRVLQTTVSCYQQQWRSTKFMLTFSDGVTSYRHYLLRSRVRSGWRHEHERSTFSFPNQHDFPKCFCCYQCELCG